MVDRRRELLEVLLRLRSAQADSESIPRVISVRLVMPYLVCFANLISGRISNDIGKGGDRICDMHRCSNAARLMAHGALSVERRPRSIEQGAGKALLGLRSRLG